MLFWRRLLRVNNPVGLEAGKAPVWRGFSIVKSMKLLNKNLLLFILGVSVFLMVIIFYFVSGDKTTAIQPNQDQTQIELPVRLKIPKIKVDASIEYVGLTSDGAMDVPKNPGEVAWFTLGPRPGEIGSAVVAGHYGLLKSGEASVFDDLNRLQRGDKIYIEDKKGATVGFIVREIRSFDPKADASTVFGSNDGKSHLNLVTCEGVWDEVSKGYPMRLVVFTDKE